MWQVTNACVVCDNCIKFGPIVITAIRENFNEILDKIM